MAYQVNAGVSVLQSPRLKCGENDEILAVERLSFNFLVVFFFAKFRFLVSLERDKFTTSYSTYTYVLRNIEYLTSEPPFRLRGRGIRHVVAPNKEEGREKGEN